MASSPTAKTLDRLRGEGWTVDIVERWCGKRITKDLFGIADILAMKGRRLLAIQATGDSGGNHAARCRKVLASPNLAKWLTCSCRSFEVWSWRPKDGRLRVTTMNPSGRTLED